MKKTVALILITILCMGLIIPVSAEYGFMDFPSYGSVFFLDRAEKAGVRSVGSNPFGIETVNCIYVESGSKCSFGGGDGYAMPPSFIRVNYVNDTMSNPQYCGSPLSEEKYECTVDELFIHCKIGKGRALLMRHNGEYYMLMINGTSLPEPEKESNIAYEQKQTITVNGEKHELTAYALKDANGGLTNYVRVRDIAALVNGTSAQFDVRWNNAVELVSGEAYQANGSEFTVPFSGEQTFTYATAPTLHYDTPQPFLSAIVITDASGGGYTYYKLRDLGQTLGFRVDWSEEKGIFIETEPSEEY
ncbi:MAG: hypothetical protein IJD97_00455 [Clostridia bacterium]|nr:hypothetical protein [Clostridia bacterium]